MPDLGKIDNFQYALDAQCVRVMDLEAVLALPGGRGPRHLVLHGALSAAYVSNELSSPITVLALNASKPDMVKSRLRAMEEVNTLSEAQRESGVCDNYVAKISMDRAGDFVYTSYSACTAAATRTSSRRASENSVNNCGRCDKSGIRTSHCDYARCFRRAEHISSPPRRLTNVSSPQGVCVETKRRVRFVGASQMKRMEAGAIQMRSAPGMGRLRARSSVFETAAAEPNVRIQPQLPTIRLVLNTQAPPACK